MPKDDLGAEVIAAKTKKPVSKPGDMICRGRHRLTCGDTKTVDINLIIINNLQPA